MTSPMPTGTSGAMAPSGFRLSGQSETLSGLENQRVEIRGTFEANPSAGASAQSMRTLRITSIRPIPGDCGAKQ